jgi:nitroreductase
MMTLRELILQNRSIRRFDQHHAMTQETLRELVDLARLSPSGANLQPLKYMLSWEPEMNAKIFPHLQWAGYLQDWDGPAPGERPAAYIIILGDRTIRSSPSCDHGIAAHSILLGASERGLGGCMIGSIERTALAQALDIGSDYDILLALALGMPAETVVLEAAESDGDIHYWRDQQGIHHVPKRPLDEIIIKRVSQ